MTVLLSQGSVLPADHCSSMSSLFVWALCFPRPGCLASPFKSSAKDGFLLTKSEQSAAVCPSPNHTPTAGLAGGNGREALPAAAGVSPGADETGAAHRLQGWKDVGWGRENTGCTTAGKGNDNQCCAFRHFWGLSARLSSECSRSELLLCVINIGGERAFLYVIYPYAVFPLLSLF